MSLKLATYNVAGLNDNMKRKTIFNFLRTKDLHLILLQETHSACGNETIWQNERGGKIALAHGTSRSRGVAILRSKNCIIESLTKLLILTVDIYSSILKLELKSFASSICMAPTKMIQSFSTTYF